MAREALFYSSWIDSGAEFGAEGKGVLLKEGAAKSQRSGIIALCPCGDLFF